MSPSASASLCALFWALIPLLLTIGAIKEGEPVVAVVCAILSVGFTWIAWVIWRVRPR